MFAGDGAVRRWFEGLAESTKANVKDLAEFFTFIELSPIQAVAWQQTHLNDYRFVEAIYKWLEGKHWTISTMMLREHQLRGFFIANRAPLGTTVHLRLH